MIYEIHQCLTSEKENASDQVADDPIEDHVVLDHLLREKGRFKVASEAGAEVRVFLERGNTLNIGDLLRSDCGKNISVRGAVESVAYAKTDDWEVFSKACYHLGNRHTKIEIGQLWLCITPDHVLQVMLESFGMTVSVEKRVFIPESGAYKRGGYGHHNDH
jgi:urease accessory protein